MYIPKDFEESRPAVLHAFIREHSFATLITSQGGVMASHLPFLLDPESGPHGTLRAHMAKANSQWKTFDGPEEALVIFQGPHAYISPSWYSSKMMVPTWNFTAVHAHGRPKIVNDPTAFRTLLRDLVAANESRFEKPWTMDILPVEFLDKLQEHIVGFEIEITKLEGKFKLSQNRPAADQAGAIAGLRGTGSAEDTRLAEVMTRVSFSELENRKV